MHFSSPWHWYWYGGQENDVESPKIQSSLLCLNRKRRGIGFERTVFFIRKVQTIKLSITLPAYRYACDQPIRARKLLITARRGTWNQFKCFNIIGIYNKDVSFKCLITAIWMFIVSICTIRYSITNPFVGNAMWLRIWQWTPAVKHAILTCRVIEGYNRNLL